VIVVDTNVVSYFILPGPDIGLAREAARRDVWCAPLLWRSEFRSVLASQMRQSGMPLVAASEAMMRAERLLWGREYSARSSTVLNCIARSQRSAYDCEFIALAEDFGTRLLTTDQALIRDFPVVAIHLRDYVRSS
jgi:predicted nucleic acid-binding protein